MEFEKLLLLVKEKYEIDKKGSWSKGSETFFEEIHKELEEVKEEMGADKQVFLEDELGDVLWDYLHLLYNLDQEGKIELENVFSRSLKKYTERVEGIQNQSSWQEIKKKQKLELEQEQKLIENSENPQKTEN